MSNLVPYLIFDGKCEKVLKYYQEVLGGELHISRYEGSPMAEKVSDDFRDKVLHGFADRRKVNIDGCGYVARTESFGRGQYPLVH